MALENPDDAKLLKPKARASKFGNKKLEIDGHRFDSKLEAAFYIAHRDEQMIIKPVFVFESGVKYIPDFVVRDTHAPLTACMWFNRIKNEGKPQGLCKALRKNPGRRLWIKVIDTKGFETAEFKIKRKLMLTEFSIQIENWLPLSGSVDAIIRGYLGNKQ